MTKEEQETQNLKYISLYRKQRSKIDPILETAKLSDKEFCEHYKIVFPLENDVDLNDYTFFIYRHKTSLSKLKLINGYVLDIKSDINKYFKEIEKTAEEYKKDKDRLNSAIIDCTNPKEIIYNILGITGDVARKWQKLNNMKYVEMYRSYNFDRKFMEKYNSMTNDQFYDYFFLDFEIDCEIDENNKKELKKYKNYVGKYKYYYIDAIVRLQDTDKASKYKIEINKGIAKYLISTFLEKML